jgi:hypothetical protein
MTTTPGPLPALDIDTADELFGAIPAPYVAAALCVRRRTLAAWRRRGVGPPSMRLGHLLTLYPTGALRQWWESPAARRSRLRVQQRRPT